MGPGLVQNGMLEGYAAAPAAAAADAAADAEAPLKLLLLLTLLLLLLLLRLPLLLPLPLPLLLPLRTFILQAARAHCSSDEAAADALRERRSAASSAHTRRWLARQSAWEHCSPQYLQGEKGRSRVGGGIAGWCWRSGLQVSP